MVSYATYPHHSRTHHHRWLLVVLAVFVGTVMVVFGAAVGAGVFYAGSVATTFNSHVTHIGRAFPPASIRPAPVSTGSMNILLLGSDSRGAPTKAGSAGISNQRSDTIMLVHIGADRNDVYVMSIMRDLWVPIPGHGTAKINAALAWGGTPLEVQTIEQLLGTRIDHVAIIDFAGLEEMTDAIGGVDVNSPVAFTASSASQYSFVKGLNHLNGAAALAFARERYAFPTADYQRVADQQALIQAIATKVMSYSVLASPAKLTSFAGAVGSYLSVDEQFDLPAMLELAASMRLSGSPGIHTFTLPTAGTGTSADGQSIVNVDQSALTRLRTALANDTLSQFVKG